MRRNAVAVNCVLIGIRGGIACHIGDTDFKCAVCVCEEFNGLYIGIISLGNPTSIERHIIGFAFCLDQHTGNFAVVKVEVVINDRNGCNTACIEISCVASAVVAEAYGYDRCRLVHTEVAYIMLAVCVVVFYKNFTVFASVIHLTKIIGADLISGYVGCAHGHHVIIAVFTAATIICIIANQVFSRPCAVFESPICLGDRISIVSSDFAKVKHYIKLIKEAVICIEAGVGYINDNRSLIIVILNVLVFI